ncbi:MAG TPA: iron chelate uptake ABC transporter family permease subunit, partial [Tetragenococcus sp.]|nr:iron chelate uptake ABC transporter family permease subunit [Tetragenococcus sp.]
MKKMKVWLIVAVLMVILLFAILLGVSFGTVSIPLGETYQIISDKLLGNEAENMVYSGIIWKIRLPRVLMGILVGAGLSLCGIVMQAVVQNPLA